MQEPLEFTVKYLGYVYVDKPGGGLPDGTAVQKAAKLLKSNQKAARALHPLFARGFDTELKLHLTDSNLRVTIQSEEKGEVVVMNHPLHKIAFVVDIGSCVCIIVKRPGQGKFNCHSFECAKDKLAYDIAFQTARVCNEMFRKIRRVSHRVRRRKPSANAKPQAAHAPKQMQQLLEEDVAAASAVAETEAATIQEATQEIAEEKVKITGKQIELKFLSNISPFLFVLCCTHTGRQLNAQQHEDEDKSKADERAVHFIDNVGDKLAALVLGVKAFDACVFEIDLDSDEFRFGEISGDAEC
eukprot:m.75344 g.75344  ORF g.75344 m.75344 type:complete len:299 (-) comp14575_c0_seq2:601-1497(-)